MKLRFLTRQFCLVLLAGAVVMLALGWVFLKYGNNTTFVAFPTSDLAVEAVSDTWEGGNTIVAVNRRDSIISFSYQLKSGFKYPYAGIKLYLAESKAAGIDLSGYDSMHIALTMSNSDAVRLFLKSYDPAVTDTSKPNSFWYHQKEFRPGQTGRTVSFSLADFTVPAWWKIQHDISEKNPGSKLKRVNHIEILNGLSITPTTYDSVTATLTSIRFSGKNGFVRTVVYGLLALIWLFTIAAITLFAVMRWAKWGLLKDFRSNAVSAYKKISFKSDEDERRDRLVRYISENYFDPDLTIDILAHKTGINRRVASNMIRTYLNTNFKGYLNQLRLNEASRLLKETDRQVTEIALSVGYKNMSHFSRIFKERFGTSPKEFRSSGG